MSRVLGDMRAARVSTAVLGLDSGFRSAQQMEDDFMMMCGFFEDEAMKAADNVKLYDELV